MKYGEGSMGNSPVPPATPAAAQPAAQRPFAVFDIDGTVIRWQLYHAVVTDLARKGLLSGEAEQIITEARTTWKKRPHSHSFDEYEKILVHTFLDTIAQVSVNDYLASVDDVFEEYKDQVYTYTRDLIGQLKDKGYLLFAISGSHNEVVSKLAAYYGFDDYHGAAFEQQNGHFTGKVVTPYGRKAEPLRALMAKHDVGFAGSIAVGDSGSDTSMLELVEQPIAFNPDQSLFMEATARDWEVVLERKNMVYHLEPKDGTFVLAQTNL